MIIFEGLKGKGFFVFFKNLFLSIFTIVAFCCCVGSGRADVVHPTDDCDPGFYFNDISGNCELCPLGHYCTDNQKKQCHAHSIAPSMGMATCTYCSGETLRYANTGHIQCVACDGIAEYVVNGVCTECGEGMFSNATHTGCFSCGSGSYIENGACTICPMGYFCSGDGTAVICPKGAFSPDVGAELCVDCAIGWTTSASGAEYCDICDEGYRMVDKDCVECEPGYYCPGGNSGAILCPKGYYAEQGSGACVPCADGYTTATSGATSADECNLCVAGYYYSDGNRCEICNAGYFCPGGNSDETICPKGLYSGAGESSCTKCPEGYTTTGEGANSADLCIYETIKLNFGGSGASVENVELPPSLKYGRINKSVVKKIRN